jgi:S-adenosylmethionine:tRNA ribosyltransferase-isomerase
VFARKSGAIAAPTAGLHFTDGTLQQLREKGIEIAEITLHVGYGTFEPVRTEQLSDHRVRPERFEIPEDAASIVNLARSEGRRVIAVGTTTVRTLESAAADGGPLIPGAGIASLTITPGYRFRMIDGLLTNFHLPRSSLLVLVSTFAGYGTIMNAYRHAVGARYRFYSYGDCMLIL